MNCNYTWSDMANALTEKNIPHSVVSKLADLQMSAIYHRPIFSLLKFDDYLHEKYGDYENENKSMKDMFELIFGEQSEKIAYYFGI